MFCSNVLKPAPGFPSRTLGKGAGDNSLPQSVKSQLTLDNTTGPGTAG